MASFAKDGDCFREVYPPIKLQITGKKILIPNPAGKLPLKIR